MQCTFAHNNFNVADLDETSLAFYEKALGLREVRRRTVAFAPSLYLGDGVTPHQLELTWLRGPRRSPTTWVKTSSTWPSPWTTYAAAHALHKAMGCICFENPAMGIYFIADPDGYWLEIVPARK